jgi:hypothetical protein
MVLGPLRITREPSAENPFRASYFLGEVDPRAMALFRILFGLAVLHDLLN